MAAVANKNSCHISGGQGYNNEKAQKQNDGLLAMASVARIMMVPNIEFRAL